MRSEFHRHTVHTQLNIDSKQQGTLPTKIADEDQTLPGNAHILLAQLRTGFCAR